MVNSLFRSASRYRTLLLPAWLGLFAPVAASADIYIWTDERGTTVISDTPPANPKRVANLETVVKEPERKSARPRTGPREPTPIEQKLLERIDDLERQVRAQTYSAPPPPAPAPAYAVTYSTRPPAPPAYDPFYTPSFFSPFSYGVPGPIVVRRGFGHRHFPHRGFPARGRR